MTYTNIVYTADNGTQYQVAVPTDFATALGQTVATTQPTLPVEVAPRYANFQTAAGLWRQAVIDTLSNFASVIGQTVTISSVVYTGMSAVGQKTPPVVPSVLSGPNMIQGPAGATGATGATGPTGPAGANGVSPLVNTAGTVTAAQLIALATTPAVLVAAPGAGKYNSMVRFSFTFKPGGTAYTAGSLLEINIGSINLSTIFTQANIQGTQQIITDGYAAYAEQVSTGILNQPIAISAFGANFATGNGTISYNILSQVLTP